MSLRCPHCLSLVPNKAARCAVCGESTTTNPPDAPADALRLAPGLTPAPAVSSRRSGGWRWLLLLIGAVVTTLVVLGGLVALALSAAAAGLGDIAWPALIAILGTLALAGLLQVERRRRRLAALLATAPEPPSLSPLEVVHLFAGRFATPAHGEGAFWPPLSPTAVRADEAAWRAFAATLLDLEEREVVELDARSIPVASGSVPVMGLRLVRPVPAGDAFASQLLHPLARRGVGASTTVSDLACQHQMLQRHPERAILESVRAHLSEQGFYRPPGIHPAGRSIPLLSLPGDWLSAALFRPLRADPNRVALAEPALAALEARLAAWDTEQPDQIRILRREIYAGLLRARNLAHSIA